MGEMGQKGVSLRGNWRLCRKDVALTVSDHMRVWELARSCGVSPASWVRQILLLHADRVHAGLVSDSVLDNVATPPTKDRRRFQLSFSEEEEGILRKAAGIPAHHGINERGQPIGVWMRAVVLYTIHTVYRHDRKVVSNG